MGVLVVDSNGYDISIEDGDARVEGQFDEYYALKNKKGKKVLEKVPGKEFDEIIASSTERSAQA